MKITKYQELEILKAYSKSELKEFIRQCDIESRLYFKMSCKLLARTAISRNIATSLISA